jgi:hypothetical protein
VDPRRLLPPLLVLTAVLVVLTLVTTGWRQWRDEAAPGARQAVGAAGVPRAAPAAVLAGWDARRARAWARGDAGELRALYAARSRAGSADVRLLRRYVGRGLRVTGLQTQVLALEVLARRPDRLDLLVTDRLVGGVAVGSGTEVPLPSDRPSRRRVVLVRVDGEWLVSRVVERPARGAQPSAAASTSRTSSSSKS